MALFHCNSVLNVGLKHFCVSFIDCFWENQCFFCKLVGLSQVGVIANNIFFSETLAVVHWKKDMVFLQFCTLRRFKAILYEFISSVLQKINDF